jgi:hypothetical protein
MSRGTRRNIIRSHEEYLSEELVVQRSNHKTYAPYHVDPSPEEDQLDMENNDEIIAPGDLNLLLIIQFLSKFEQPWYMH